MASQPGAPPPTLRDDRRRTGESGDSRFVLANLGFILLKTQFYDQSIDFSNKALSIKRWPHAYQNL